MEKAIREANGCTNFIATITYADTTTQTPSKYKYEYILKGNKVVDEFVNKNPDGTSTSKPTVDTNKNEKIISGSVNKNTELAQVDTNGNGKVTIAEAKKAGYDMPIHSDHWLYKYMNDKDGDGVVGE